ncbi:hypothetical protein Tco_0947541 [Tanacetum coccineum]
MATTDKESSAAGMDNRPPMLEENDFESWKIWIERYIRGEGEQQTQVTREKTDKEFTEAENNKERADIQATNILSQGLPRHVFNTLNQTETAKEIWENVELLMQGSGNENADPLAYMAQATQSTSSPSQYVPPSPQYEPAPQQAP